MGSWKFPLNLLNERLDIDGSRRRTRNGVDRKLRMSRMLGVMMTRSNYNRFHLDSLHAAPTFEDERLG